MGDRGTAYHTQDACADTLEVVNKRLNQDLRHRVRRIAYSPPLSPEWRDVADIIGHISNIASMESKDSLNRPGSSVWERDELCIRYIIEESKTNLLMRLMIDFKSVMYDKQPIETSSDPEVTSFLKQFEASMGELLRCLFTAVEALQTLDMSAMIEYIERALNAANTDPGTYDAQSQEVVVISYLYLILSHIERLDEDKVLGLMLDHSILPAVLRHFEHYHSRAGDRGVEMYVWLVSFLLDTEYFKGHMNQFFASKEDKKRLGLLEPAAKAIKATEPEADLRRKVRTLCDFIIRYK
ncbi:hypothetical protein DIPPA_00094 [Diplonema papillatum]|nr:hypothetical protein DIPPA_00094 [Diplonema papillatum]